MHAFSYSHFRKPLNGIVLLVLALSFLPTPRMVEAAPKESVQPAPLISPPDLPTLVSPSNGATDVPISTTLTVHLGDSVIGPADVPADVSQSVSFYGRPKVGVGEDFSLIVLPDPQMYALAGNEDIYYSQMQWVIDNQSSRNIPYVISLGDNVNDSRIPSEWGVATTAFDMLTTAGIPYGTALGNHDALVDSSNFNFYFNDRITSQATYGGAYIAGASNNYYTLFQAGGLKFIVIFIEYKASSTLANMQIALKDILPWANGLLSTYSDRRAIVITHNLLAWDNSFTDQGYVIYTALKGNPNLFLMMGGHLLTYRVGLLTSPGSGHPIYSLKSDYQDVIVNGRPSGYLRIMRFSPADNLIHVTTYSPNNDLYYPDTDLNNTFNLPYNMNGSGSYQLIGTAENIPSGSDASVTWSGLINNTDYEWYAVTSFGTEDATSPTWTFTTEAASVPHPFDLTVNISGTGDGTVISVPAGIDCGSTCSYSFDNNTSVTLAATPSPGSTFTGWSGGICSGTDTCTVTMNAAKSVTATFTLNTYTLSVSKTGTGSGTVTSSPAGINCGATCSASFNDNTSVTLTAAAGIGSTFTGWSGGICSGTGACTVTMDAAKSVTATFTLDLITYTLSVSKTGTGGGTVISSPAGINCGATCSASFNDNTSVTLTAAATTGSIFTGWSGGVCSGTGTCIVTLDAAKSVMANYTAIEYTLAITSTHGTVVKSPNQTTYHYGDVVQLSATPSAGRTFSSWSGGATGTTNPIDVTINSNMSVTANYTVAEYTLIVTSAHGAVDKTPQQATYHYGDVIQLSATPSAGWTFSNWSGGATGTTNPINVTINANMSVTANYTAIEYTLVITSTHGTVVKSPNQATYHYGDVVQLTATPSAGWTFSSWSGDVTGTTNPINVTINGNMSVTANNTAIEYTLAITSANGTVVKSPNQATYHYGDVIQLSATPAAGWTFSNWSGGATGTTNPINVTINANMSVTANFTLNSSNNDFNSATLINTTPYSAIQDISTATTASDDPTFTCASGGQKYKSVWYRFVPSATGTLNVNSTGSNYDTVLAIWTGSPGSLTSIGCNDDSGGGVQSTLSLAVTQGQIYYLEVAAYYNVGGTLKLNASFTPTNTYTLSVTRAGTGSGTVTSSPAGINCGATCSASFNSNTSVTLTASAGTGSTFTGWSGGVCSGTGTCLLTMNAVKSITATFTLFAPSAPANVQASDGTYTDKVQITWTASGGASIYKVFRATSSTGAKGLLGSPTVTSFNDTQATPGVTYTYWVMACAGTTCSGYSTYNTGWRNLSAPTGVTASNGLYSDKVRITWIAASGATSYKVYRATSLTGIKSLLSSPSGKNFDDKTALRNVVYYYWVSTCRGANCSTFSATDTGYRK